MIKLTQQSSISGSFVRNELSNGSINITINSFAEPAPMSLHKKIVKRNLSRKSNRKSPTQRSPEIKSDITTERSMPSHKPKKHDRIKDLLNHAKLI